MVSGEEITFTNCDGNPNAYIAFFPNPEHSAGTGYDKAGKDAETSFLGKKSLIQMYTVATAASATATITSNIRVGQGHKPVRVKGPRTLYFQTLYPEGALCFHKVLVDETLRLFKLLGVQFL